VSGKNPRNLSRLDKKDAHTLEGLREYFHLYPSSFDWMNDRSAKLMLDTVQTVITLFIANGQHNTELHLLFPQPPDNPFPVRASREGSPRNASPRARRNTTSHSHFLLLKKSIMPMATASIRPMAYRYPKCHPSSGIFNPLVERSKFIP
jgi:hypothetical protein